MVTLQVKIMGRLLRIRVITETIKTTEPRVKAKVTIHRVKATTLKVKVTTLRIKVTRHKVGSIISSRQQPINNILSSTTNSQQQTSSTAINKNSSRLQAANMAINNSRDSNRSKQTRIMVLVSLTLLGFIF